MKSEPVRQTEISALVSRIHAAMQYLTEVQHYKLEELRLVTGGGSLAQSNGTKLTILSDKHYRQLLAEGQLGKESERLHKNSVLKIRDLRYALAVRRYINRRARTGKLGWVAAKSPRERGDDDKRASLQWLWSPQIDTIERLERLITEAHRLGFEAEQRRAAARRSKRSDVRASEGS